MPGLFRSRQRAEHEFGRANLSLYLDERLSGRDKQRLERHLVGCPACQADLATLRQTVSLLRHAPVRRAPRSFALPAAAQRQQAAYRRWGVANAALRVSALAVSFLLVLFVSSDVWLGFQALPTASAPVPVAAKLSLPTPVAQPERAMAPAPQQPATAAPAAQPAATAAKLAAAQPTTIQPTVAAEAVPQGELNRAPAQPPEGLRDEGAAGAHGGGVVERAITAPARATARVASATPAPTAVSRVVAAVGTVTQAADDSTSKLGGKPTGALAVGEQTAVLGTKATGLPTPGGAFSVTLAVSATLPTDVAPPPRTPTASLSKAGSGMAPTIQPATPTALPVATLPPTRRPSPTSLPPTQAAPTQVVGQPTTLPTQGQIAKSFPQPRPTASPEHVTVEQSPSVPYNAWVWPLWRTARTFAGLSVGLLLILLAGILWSGQKRRI